MKTLILIFLALMLTTACNESTTNNNSETRQITATINGKKFSATSILITEEAGTYRKKLRIFGETGNDSLSIHLYFEPYDSIKAGTYTFSKDGYFIGIYNHSGIADTATEGTIKLEKFVGPNPIKANGTFNFIIKYNNTITYTVSNGIFNTGK